jgi:hypothetical protein
MKNAEAKNFMSRVVAWPSNEGPGWINLEWQQASSQQPGRTSWHGRPFKKVDDFLSFASWASSREGISNIYFCLSQQRDTGLTRSGKVKAARSQEAALALKAIWLDIDVKKPPKGYASLTEAADALAAFIAHYRLPAPSALVASGGGLHAYWISDRPLAPAEWQPYANGLKAAAMEHGLHCDAGVTADAARVLRVPGTQNFKTHPPRPVRLLGIQEGDYDFATALAVLPSIAPAAATANGARANDEFFDPALFPKREPIIEDSLSEGIERPELPPLAVAPIAGECAFIREALETGGREYAQPLWNLTTLCATFLEDGNALAHRMGNKHPGYTHESTEELWERKVRERKEKNLGWPSCRAIRDAGCKSCATCPHFAKGKSPLNLAHEQPTPPAEPSFVDPYAEFVGPPFPVDVLPPTLAKFVDAEHRAMGADPSALAMAALTAVAGAMHAETLVCAGEGWWERPILWTFLIGLPSSMKSPIIDKTTKPLSRIDHERNKIWQQEYAIWQQANEKAIKAPLPPRRPRCIINDVTPEKVAEFLSRNPCGSLLVHDELAGWIGSFERYSQGASARPFFLSCWNGGPHNKDRVGRGKTDPDAEIHVENLALSILGGIQPDRLAALGDLTSDGLLQRSLPCLMKSAERGDEYYPVATAEADYEELIKSVSAAPPEKYYFNQDALEVRDRVNDHLHRLEQVDGFSSALIGAIGKLRGYFARFCLVLEVAWKNDRRSVDLPEWMTPADAERSRKIFGYDPADRLSAGINPTIRRQTAEAVEKLLHQYLLPHTFGLYDVVANGGQDRDMLRSIGDFILASPKDRLRPSDFTAGVRALRGRPEQKIREWAGRFCAMGWLQSEEARPGVPPKAWLVVPGLREHFAERRKQAETARAQAHAILRAGGSRRSHD